MPEIKIDAFDSEMADETIKVLARAFVTNPLNMAVFGAEELALNESFFRGSLPVMKGRKLVARDGYRIVGFIHWVTSPGCQFNGIQKLMMFPRIAQEFGLQRALRIGSWLSVWSKHDPKAPHCHLGPIGIDPTAQGRGIGGQLMKQYCDDLDQTSLAGYLETDRPENVAFYRRFGFEVLREVSVLGTRNFLMGRGGAVKSER